MKIFKSIVLTVALLLMYTANAQHSLLYKIEGENFKTSYVFGTLHLMPQKDFNLKQKVKDAFEQAETIYMELDMDDPNMLKEMMGHLTLGDGKKLDSFMDTDEFSFLDDYFKSNFKMSLEQLNSFKPFYLSSMLMTKMMGEQVASYEGTFIQMAKAAEKEIKGLETIGAQMAALDTQPYDEQIDDMIEMLKDSSQVDLFEKMLAIYKNEDVNKLFDYMDEYFNEDENMIDVLLFNRNIAWVKKIPEISKEQGVFYAVGAGHLGGKKGVLQLLKDKGFTVTPVLD